LVALVAAHESPDSWLEPAVAAPVIDEVTGNVIGRYRLLEKLDPAHGETNWGEAGRGDGAPEIAGSAATPETRP